VANKVAITDYFLRGMRALPPDRQRRAIAAIEKFMRDAAVPSLDFRPLKGKADFFIIDANSGDRIILKRVEADTYEAMDVGPHDNVYRRWNR
jgi:hypothetical protein